jgi:hypothetical protein
MKISRITRARLGAAVVVLAMVVGQSSASANHNQWSHCNHPNGLDRFSDQYTANTYTGLAGQMWTYQPSVPNLQTDFSLSHLYMFTDNFTPFIEVGWYRGFGPQKIASNSSYYTAREEPGQPYLELNFEDVPNAQFIGYKVENVGFDDGTAKWHWAVYHAPGGQAFGSPFITWALASVNWARALSGGEVTTRSGIQMQVFTAAPHILLNPGDAQWHNWTDAYMAETLDTTFTCNDPGFFLSYNVRFDNYVISGNNP